MVAHLPLPVVLCLTTIGGLGCLHPSHNPITSETSVSTGDEVVDTRPISIASRIDMSKSMTWRHCLYESTCRWRHSNDINFAQRDIELVMTL